MTIIPSYASGPWYHSSTDWEGYVIPRTVAINTSVPVVANPSTIPVPVECAGPAWGGVLAT